MIREAYRYIFLIFFSALLLALIVEFLWNGVDRLMNWLVPRSSSINQGCIGLTIAKVGTRILLVGPVAAFLAFHSAPFLAAQPNEDQLSPITLYRHNKIIDYLIERQNEEGLFRIFNYQQCLPRNLGNAFSLLTIRGHRATIYAPYFDFFVSALADPYSERLDELGVKYVVSPDPLENLELITTTEHLFLYERPKPVPIFRLADQQCELAIQDLEWRQNAVVVELSQSFKGILVFAQPHYPSWKVEVDGQERDLLKSGLFMGVKLVGTESTVKFLYRPVLLKFGLIGTVIPLLLVGAGVSRRSLTPRDQG